jgi:hypothetical protein
MAIDASHRASTLRAMRKSAVSTSMVGAWDLWLDTTSRERAVVAAHLGE